MDKPTSSPITAELLVSGAVGISEVVADGSDVYWAESRPSEAGRTAIVRWRDGVIDEITGSDVNVRTRVHEYGGGAWWVAGGLLVCSDDSRGGELFRIDPETGAEVQLTSSGHRYADGRLSADGQWFVCVRERHVASVTGPPIVENEIVAVSTDAQGVELVLLATHDFFSSPRFGLGGQLVCVAWNNPDMPWDSTELVTIGPEWMDGEPHPVIRRIPGQVESIVLPDWTSDGQHLAVSDRSNWWNLVEVEPETGAHTPVVQGEFEVATPGWVFGLSRWCETTDGIVMVASTPHGDTIGFPSGSVEDRHTAVTSIRSLADGRIVYAGSSYQEESAVWVHDGSTAHRLSNPRDLGLDESLFPEPELITFPVDAIDTSEVPGTTAHALFYEPATLDESEDTALPPLLVMVHGGPTAAARRQLHLVTRYWTSRGVAVVDVDYRGSTLYGRLYRNELRGGWGVTDVVDCVAAATYLAQTGRVDPERMVIAGGSAGGLTVLNALAHHDVFTGGISRYGVADLRSLATDTHKFEARYLDRLVGRWPQDEHVYIDRSPVTHADKITAPLLVLQGEDDMVVPPNQAEMIVDAVRSNGAPVTYHLFEGEGHGFRKAETIVAVLAAEEAFVASL